MRFTPYRTAPVGSPTGFKYRKRGSLFKRIIVTRRDFFHPIRIIDPYYPEYSRGRGEMTRFLLLTRL